MKFLAELPTTQLRIVITLLIVIGTALVFLISGRGAEAEWLTFLAAMSGLDALQHIGKRATTKPEMTVTVTENGNPPSKTTTTTVSTPDPETTHTPPARDQGEE